MIDDQKILDHLGKIKREEKLNQKILVESETGKFLVTGRSKFSDAQGIIELSKYGAAHIEAVTEHYILERFMDNFVLEPLSLKSMAKLLRDIHKESNNFLTLVHGDFSRTNTTYFNGTPKCLDYEYCHWGSPYIDIGRVILRECETLDDVFAFFYDCNGALPSPANLRKGLMEFCDWQNKIRREKKAVFSEVPLVRKQRVISAEDNLESILQAFKSEVESSEVLAFEVNKYERLFASNPKYNSNPNHDRFNVAEKYIREVQPKSILDIGVGRGHFFKRMRNQGHNISGIEPSEVARNLLNDSSVVFGYAHEIPFPNLSFDAVVCLDVLEHVPHEFLYKSLSEIARASKKYAILSVASHGDVVDGIELHISSMPFDDWRREIAKYFAIEKSETVCSKADSQKISEVYLLTK